MKKKLVLRCLIGAPIGFALSTAITIVISLIVGDGNFYPVGPQLITDCGSEINAVLCQAFFALLYGAAWGGGSVIWEKEEWSLLRQTLTHLIVCSAFTLPIAYFMYWIPHNGTGILLYFGIFFGVYAAIWLSQYFATKRRLRKMNERLNFPDFR